MEINEKDFTLSDSIGHYVNIVANKMKLELENSFEKSDYDITSLQWMFVRIIYENEGITQNELSKISKKDKTNIARIIEKIEKKGYIKRVRDDIDKRIFRLFTTPLGRTIRDELIHLAMDTVNKSVVNVSREEYDICLRVLKKIHSNLE